jgi:hypothetical protein
MGCHVAQGRSRNAHAIQAINMFGRHRKPHSRMEDDHKRTQRMEGQLPHTSLMAPSMSHGRGMTTGTRGGGCAHVSLLDITLGWPWHVTFCFFALSRLFSSQLSGSVCPHSQISLASSSIMSRERGKPRRGPSWY